MFWNTRGGTLKNTCAVGLNMTKELSIVVLHIASVWTKKNQWRLQRLHEDLHLSGCSLTSEWWLAQCVTWRHTCHKTCTYNFLHPFCLHRCIILFRWSPQTARNQMVSGCTHTHTHTSVPHRSVAALVSLVIAVSSIWLRKKTTHNGERRRELM